jgi:hypothetical protein
VSSPYCSQNKINNLSVTEPTAKKKKKTKNKKEDKLPPEWSPIIKHACDITNGNTKFQRVYGSKFSL